MAIEIRMPALSPTMTDGTLSRWLVKEGDEVRSGDVIAEIETDKATMEVEAIDDGVMAVIAVAAGTQNVAVNAVIAMLAEDGEDAASITVSDAPAAAPSQAPVAEQAESQPVSEAKPASMAPSTPSTAATPAPTAQPAQEGRVFASPLARRIAAQNNLPLTGLKGTGPNGRIIKFDVETLGNTLGGDDV